ncbi:glycosyl transferase [Glycocaulis alkaliphilus]|nr:glycosyltransferase family 2 protein [Glycocaulis alkaliphilus]GGB84335.1 glycosyl transferase [Glycocaulis alkaliphilus]
MSSGGRISAVMVSYRTGPVLFDSIRSVLSDPDIHELVLVNHDNPTNVTVRLDTMAAAEPRLNVIHTGANLGFGRGCNIGARSASGDYILLLNPDTLIARGAARIMVSTAQTLPPVSIVGARILNTDGTEQRGGRRGGLTLMSAMLSFTGLARILPGIRDFHRENEPLPSGPVEAPSVSGAAMLMSRETYRALKGFDERYFLHVEDIDICERARRMGGRIVFEPRAAFVHVGSTSSANILLVEWYKAKGLNLFFRTYSGPAGQLALVVAGPLMTMALLGRALLIRVNVRASQARNRVRARLRLAQRRRNAGD